MSKPTASIDATYENVVAKCPHCATRNVFNRRSDLNDLSSIANANVTCASCGGSFDIGGDLINPAHEMLLLDCRPLFDSKQYMLCVLTMAQAYEVFFSHFVYVQLLYRPVGRDSAGSIDLANRLGEKLYAKLERFTFEPMRRVFLRLVVDGTAPATLAEAEACIDALPNRARAVPEVAREVVDAVPDERLRSLLLSLHATEINRLRNQVVHKDAYRPARDETWQAYQEASVILFGLTGCLRLKGDANWYINGAERFDDP